MLFSRTQVDLTSRGKMSSDVQVILLFVLFSFVCFLDDDLEGYDKMVSGRRKTGRVSHVYI